MSAFEEWRKVDSWPYEVSDRGRVRRCQPGAMSGRYGKHSATYAGKLLKAKQDNDGYLVVTLCDRGRLKTAKIHVLVCIAFNSLKPSPKHQIRHLDGDNTNNHPSNLRWGTAADNAADRERHGTTRRGETSTRALFTQAEVDYLRTLYQNELANRRAAGFQRVERMFMRKLATRFNLKPNTLACIASGRGYA